MKLSSSLGLALARFIFRAHPAADRLTIEVRRCAASRPVAVTTGTFSLSWAWPLYPPFEGIVRGQPGCWWAWRVGESVVALGLVVTERGNLPVCSWCGLIVHLIVRGE